MRFLFAGGFPNECLMNELRGLGHEVFWERGWDWYTLYADGVSTPRDWGTAITKAVAQHKPDVFVVSKGGLWRKGTFWKLDGATLWWMKSQVKKMVYISFDDPAFTPVPLAEGILLPFDLWGTVCIGLKDLFPAFKTMFAGRLFEFWQGWDSTIPQPITKEPELDVDLAIAGTPYYRPFPPPHFQGGFSGARRVIAHAALKAKIDVGLWGRDSWLKPENGGDPAFASIFKGWMPTNEMHRLSRSAKVILATHLVEGYRYESGRIPRTGGAGGCLLHEDRPGLKEEFGNSIEWYKPGDVADCINKLKALLADSERRLQMARDLHEIVMNKHTWRHRAEQLVYEIERG